jgi:hypothetical protein
MTSVSKDGVIYSTSERLAELGVVGPKLLKGYSRIFIRLKNDIAAFQNRPDIIQLRPRVFARIQSKNSTRLPPIQGSSSVLTFIPRRDITKTGRTDLTTTREEQRRYLLVTFDPVKHKHQRRVLSRIYHRTPMIRIKPGIVLLPQIRTKRVRRYVPALLRPSEFLSRLVELCGTVEYFPRLELVSSHADQMISQFIHSQFETRAQRIVNCCRNLFHELKSMTGAPGKSSQTWKTFLRLRSQLRLLRKQAHFFNNEFGLDLYHFVNRVASAVTRVRNKLNICDT